MLFGRLNKCTVDKYCQKSTETKINSEREAGQECHLCQSNKVPLWETLYRYDRKGVHPLQTLTFILSMFIEPSGETQ